MDDFDVIHTLIYYDCVHVNSAMKFLLIQDYRNRAYTRHFSFPSTDQKIKKGTYPRERKKNDINICSTTNGKSKIRFYVISSLKQTISERQKE